MSSVRGGRGQLAKVSTTRRGTDRCRRRCSQRSDLGRLCLEQRCFFHHGSAPRLNIVVPFQIVANVSPSPSSLDPTISPKLLTANAMLVLPPDSVPRLVGAPPVQSVASEFPPLAELTPTTRPASLMPRAKLDAVPDNKASAVGVDPVQTVATPELLLVAVLPATWPRLLIALL